MSRSRNITLDLFLSRKLLRCLERRADELGLDVQTAIRQAVRDFVRRKGKGAAR